MIQTLSIFTLTLILLSASIVVVSARSNLSKNLKSCVEITTKLNRNRRQGLKRLFSLNPKAKALRIKRKIAEQTYRSAPTPPLKAAAFTALQAVKLLQKSLRAVQKAILISISAYTQSFKLRVTRRKSFILKISNQKLVKAYPHSSDSPSYKTASNFNQKTRVLIKTSVNLVENLPNFISKILKNKKGFVECGSVLTSSKKNQMKIHLLGGRSF